MFASTSVFLSVTGITIQDCHTANLNKNALCESFASHKYHPKAQTSHCFLLHWAAQFGGKGLHLDVRKPNSASYHYELTLSQSVSSLTQSGLTLCNPMSHRMPGLLVHHQLPEFTQIHVHRVSDAIWPSHPLLSPSPPASNTSQHQGLFQ